MNQEITGAILRPIVDPLLSWYDKQARILPWREDPQPYHVWVSEIMLQQTRVEAVKPYYDRFLEALPSIDSLARAGEEALMKLWEGLGYYSRVRNLQKAARIVMQEYGGQLPSDTALLEKLPGIGPYTAGAISSIAYGKAAPAVDGNVLRVISRIAASYADVSSPRVKKQVEAAVTEILPLPRVGDFNQSLMELGAMVCLPNGVAKCAECPVREICRARQRDIVMELPVKAAKKPRKVEHRTVLVLFCNSRVALRRRPETGLLSGMWELPNLEGCLSKEEALTILRGMGGEVSSLSTLKKAKHIFTHIEWQMSGYTAKLSRPIGEDEWVWADQRLLQEQYALPSAFKAYRGLIEDYFNQDSF